MIETNLTEFQNYTYVFDESPSHITGLINSSTTVNLDITGNVSSVCRVQGMDILLQMEILQSVVLILILVFVIIMFVMMFRRKQVVI